MLQSNKSNESGPIAPRDIIGNISYEIMPFRGTEEAVLEHVPTDVALTVTVTEAKGLSATVDLASRLRARGYRTAPHLAARMVKDTAHAKDLLGQLTDAGVDRVIILGGDAPRPTGQFTAAIDLLRVVHETGQFLNVGIGGYPEGHATIEADTLDAALSQKAPLATHVISQICFDANATTTWARQIHRYNPNLGVLVGVPAPVSSQKLFRISASIGLGQSARFLRKQQHVLWKLMSPGLYRPDKLLHAFAPHLRGTDINVHGFHLFTFNELQKAEAWRRQLQDRLTSECTKS